MRSATAVLPKNNPEFSVLSDCRLPYCLPQSAPAFHSPHPPTPWANSSLQMALTETRESQVPKETPPKTPKQAGTLTRLKWLHPHLLLLPPTPPHCAGVTVDANIMTCMLLCISTKCDRKHAPAEKDTMTWKQCRGH